MATYDYRCPKCGRIEEKTHGINDSPSYVCVKCDKHMKRVFTPIAVHGANTGGRKANT
jgi:putative FmdB family regulatory protein